ITYSACLIYCCCASIIFSPQRCTLFPYTTLFRSQQHVGRKRGEQPREERARKRHHVEGLTHGRKRDARSRQNAERSQPRYLPRRSEEHTSELQSRFDLVCRLLLEKKKKNKMKSNK